uniref:Hyaluronan and proteoglycan link protein 1 n=1 Tax=Scleropages formosus TaxID=113540 RepID=A0A8C9T8F3_SCLFO
MYEICIYKLKIPEVFFFFFFFPPPPENGLQLSVVTEQIKVLVRRGDNATLPCRLNRSSQTSFDSSEMRVKWTKLPQHSSEETFVLVSVGIYRKTYGTFNHRVYLQEADENDASLIITNVTLDDYGNYKCEVISGLDDSTNVVSLELEGLKYFPAGVVFPYSPRLGRYNLNYHDAATACLEQDAVVASFDQLFDAWVAGLDWCNAGWLSDGSVQYPITTPREPCGGKNTVAGVRSYGQRDKDQARYDVFCFTSDYRGRFYFLIHPSKLTYKEAVQACKNDGAEIAKVGQIYAAWKLLGFDRCDAGWLADGSVRYPISNPRRNCSPTEAAVRFVGFPDKKLKLYGVYCFKASK